MSETITKPAESKVFIQVLSLDAHIHAELCARLIVWAKRGAFPSALVGVSPVDHARNEAVRSFFKHNYDYLFFVDDDTIPPFDAVQKLVKLCEDGADIATGVTPILRRDDKGNAFTCNNCFTSSTEDEGGTRMEAVDSDSGIHQVIRCGGSCLLIKREALMKIGEPWFQIKWNKDYTGYIGEDLSFCDKAKAAGLKIMCDSSVICMHHKDVML